MALNVIAESPPELRMNLTLTLAVMVAQSMRTISDLTGAASAQDAWSRAILLVLSGHEEE
jgi:hypothetical protein